MFPAWHCISQRCNCIWLFCMFFAYYFCFQLFVPVQHRLNMQVSPHLWTGANDRTESQSALKLWKSLWLSPQSLSVPENTGEKAKTFTDSVGRKQRNGGIWDQQPPRWIHTSVIFIPAWASTVNNTWAHASGVWRRPSLHYKYWGLGLCETQLI